MTETPTVVTPVTPTPTGEGPSVAVSFAPGKLVMLGLIGMVGALAILLFQAMHERDEYRRSLNELRPEYTPVTSPNGKFDGPVSVPDPATAETRTDSPASEV